MYLFFELLFKRLLIVSSTSLLINNDSLAFSIFIEYFIDQSPLLFESGKSIISVSIGFPFLESPGLHPSFESNILSHKPTGFSNLSINEYSRFENSYPNILCL